MGKTSAFNTATAAYPEDFVIGLKVSGSNYENAKFAISTLRDGIISNLGSGAGLHNAIYRGKNLGTSITAAQWTAINSGAFTDMFIGDYWTLNGRVYRIAHFDYWLNTGDTVCTKHHVVLVPDASMVSAKMNETNTTDGGYAGSLMRGEGGGLETATATITNDIGDSHLLTHRSYLSNAVSNGAATAAGWYDSMIDLMSETMVYGHPVTSSRMTYGHFVDTGIDKTQLALFALDPSQITKRSFNWWLRSVASESLFAAVNADGSASYGGASYSRGVRPAFGIVQSA